MTTETLTEFARRLGVVPSYVTKLKQADRLVLTADGRVDAEASMVRIAETADKNRDDVATRHAAARGATLPTVPAEPAKPDERSNSYQGARAVKEKYSALLAKSEYEQVIGNLVPREEVEAALKFIGAAFYSLLKNFPGQNASILASITDPNEIEEQLEEGCRNMQIALGEMIDRQRALVFAKKA